MSQEKRRLRRAIQKFITPKSRFVKVQINGHDLIIDTNDTWMRNNFLHCDIYEPETTKYIEENVKRHERVIDVGAHIGYHSLNFAMQGAWVTAYEPDYTTLLLLWKNSNHRISYYNNAVSDVEGWRPFYLSKGGSAWNSIFPIEKAQPVQVYSIRLDNHVKLPVHWVKIDVEGAELKVLQGMKKTLEISPDLRLIIEWLPKNGGDLEGILNLLDGWQCRPLDHNMLFWRNEG